MDESLFGNTLMCGLLCSFMAVSNCLPLLLLFQSALRTLARRHGRFWRRYRLWEKLCGGGLHPE